jgi:hypothetical protein
VRRALGLGLFAALGVALLADTATALGPVDATLGYDYYRGPAGQLASGPMGSLAAEHRSYSAELEISHFDDNQIGRAWEITGTLKAPLMPGRRLVVAGTGFAGDSTRGAWRAKLGGEFALGRERVLTAFATLYDDAAGDAANGLGAELDWPPVPTLTAETSLLLERSQGTAGVAATATLGWQPVDLFEISGEAGLSINGTGLTGPLPPRDLIMEQHSGRSPSSGPGRSGKSSSISSGTTSTDLIALVGVRLHF